MSFTARLPLVVLAALILLVACAGKPRGPRGLEGPGGVPGGDMTALQGAYFARPVALLLTGYDRDGDARITEEELRAGAETEWSRMDRAGDGTVSLIDLSSWAETYLGSATARPGHLSFDENRNNAIEPNEVVALLLREFRAGDKNADGVLSRNELIRQLNIPQMGGGKRGGRPNGGGRGGPGGGMPPGGGGRM